MNRFTFLLLGVATMAGISHIVSAQQPGMFFATNPNGGGMVMAHGPLGVADASDGIITFNYASGDGRPTAA